jgi:hypothetical protein
MYRAIQSEQPDARFRDPWARRLRRRMRCAWVFDVLSALQPRARREPTRRFAGYALLERT